MAKLFRRFCGWIVYAGQGYSFDRNGTLTHDAEGREFVFNGDNKQRLVKVGTDNVGEYFYDAEGKRVRKIEYNNGVVQSETVFVYSSGKLVEEYSTTPPPTTGTTKYTATDHLGSPRVITDASGQVISRRDFMPNSTLNELLRRYRGLKSSL